MALTVADVLKLKPFATGKVIAGENGVTRKVEHVSVMEVDITEWFSSELVRGASLEISSMYALVDHPERQVEAIRRLNKSGAAGLVLCYVGTVLKDVSQELIDVCNELDFPLIVMFSLVGYKEIIRAVSDALLGLDNQKLRDAIDIYEYVTELLMESRNNSSLVMSLEHMLEKRVMYFDQNAEPIYISGFSRARIQMVERYIKNHFSEFLLHHSSQTISCPGIDEQLYLRPIYNKAFYFGTLVIVGCRFSDLDKIAIAQICNALSISSLSQISISQQQEKLRTDFIRDLLTIHLSEEDIFRRSTAIHCDISQVEGCIVLDICNFKQLIKQYSEEKIASLKRDFYELVQSELSALGDRSICCVLSDKVVILHIQTPKQTILQVARSLQRVLKRKNIEVSAGIGYRCKSVRDIQTSYETARLALQIATSGFAPSTCVDSEEFPAYMMLLQTYQADPGLVPQVIDRLLAPVRQYDQTRNGALEETFRALLRCDMNYNLVAEQLFFHKNTVLQRKQKIVSLYKEDPFQLPLRRQFEFAFILEGLYVRKGSSDSGDI